MPFMIRGVDCISCGVCEPVCPNGGIRKDPDKAFYVIDPNRCTECVGFFRVPQCVAVCPMDCCIPDPRNTLTEAELFERAKAGHQEGSQLPVLTVETSRFRKPSRVKWWKRLLPFAQAAAEDVTVTESADSTSLA